MKLLFFAVCMFFSIGKSSAQDKIGTELDLIHNEAIEFELHKIGGANLLKNGTMNLPAYFIEVVNPTFDSVYLNKYRNDIIKYLALMLADSNKDWAANLLLYHITQKDAFHYLGVENRSQWEGSLKKEDSLFWNKNR